MFFLCLLVLYVEGRIQFTADHTYRRVKTFQFVLHCAAELIPEGNFSFSRWLCQ